MIYIQRNNYAYFNIIYHIIILSIYKKLYEESNFFKCIDKMIIKVV